jgi:protein subunit release factor B
MQRLGIADGDLVERFARSSGPGGQNVNKVSTAVTLSHPASGITVMAQDSRSQAMNRQLARLRLLDAIEAAQRAERESRKAARAKVRRQNSKRPRGLKERILETKRRRSSDKKLRGVVRE